MASGAVYEAGDGGGDPHRLPAELRVVLFHTVDASSLAAAPPALLYRPECAAD